MPCPEHNRPAAVLQEEVAPLHTVAFHRRRADIPDVDAPALIAVAARTTEAMPLYEYELCEGNCTMCGGRFTLRRPLEAPPLTQCPLCKKPVRKIISQVNTPRATKPVSISDAKQAGFTVLKRSSKGEYERQ